MIQLHVIGINVVTTVGGPPCEVGCHQGRVKDEALDIVGQLGGVEAAVTIIVSDNLKDELHRHCVFWCLPKRR